jgi:hypothetical protein
MDKRDIKIGEEYGLREARQPGAPLQRVRILEHVRAKKWRAEWIDPNTGLKDYVESQHLVVRWKDRKAFLRDEENERRLREHNARLEVKVNSPVAEALQQVFETAGDDLFFDRGVLSGHPDALRRVRESARLKSDHPLGTTYVDRGGRVHVPFDEALDLGRAFCAVEPSPVLTSIESTEREWSQEASRPGGEHLVSLLNKYRASWAIIRQWTGLDPAIAAREEQIRRLERLVWDAIYALQKAGLDSEASRLRRSLQRT